MVTRAYPTWDRVLIGSEYPDAHLLMQEIEEFQVFPFSYPWDFALMEGTDIERNKQIIGEICFTVLANSKGGDFAWEAWKRLLRTV